MTFEVKRCQGLIKSTQVVVNFSYEKQVKFKKKNKAFLFHVILLIIFCLFLKQQLIYFLLHRIYCFNCIISAY